MNRIFKLSLLCMAITTAFSSFAENADPQQESGNLPGQLAVTSTNINMFSLPLRGNSRSWQLTENSGKELAVTLSNVMLPKGAWIEVIDILGNKLAVYNEKTLYDGSKPVIITPPTDSGGVVVKVVTPDKNEHQGSLIISQYRSAQNQSKAIIGDNQMKQAACYESINPTFFAKSHAVVKANSGSGWNVVGGPYVITNHHVAGDVGNKIHSLSYNYQYPSCDQKTPLNILPIKTESVVIAGNGGAKDLAVYKVDSLAYEEAGIKQIFGTLAINSETPKDQLIKNVPVYIAQHPWGDYKRISSLQDGGGACHTLSGLDKYTLGYNCDTAGGSSGSPVLAQADNRVVALHRAGGTSTNVGVLGSYLYSFVKDLLPESNHAEAATLGEGKVLVKPLNFYPYMPQPVIDPEVNDKVTLTSLQENRLTDDGHSTLFKARARVSGGDIVDVNLRLSLTTPCGKNNFSEAAHCETPGNRYLNSWITEKDNPVLNSFSGWATLQINNSQGERLHNLILPITYAQYDPFSSPFGDSNNVREYNLTSDQTLTTEQITHTSNFGFVAVYDGQGPLTTMGGGTGYTTLKVQVKNKQDGQVYIMTLRGNRKTTCSPSLRPINSITGCGNTKPASLVLKYHAEDNEALPKGTYTGLLPILAKRDNTEVAPLLIHIDITK